MIPFFSQSSIPIDRHRIHSGRPLSRLEVHQQYLDHERQRRLHLSSEVRHGSGVPLRNHVVRVRHSFGRFLISFGSWMAREIGANPALASRR